ncbi:MAG: dihydroxy-acid dehydratase [Clostridiales bacterium]|nr:dihydroxy-acid dehydratase [Clostridiales bacterium]
MLREFIDQLDKLPQKIMANCIEIDTDKPLIGIISAQNEVSTAHKNLDELCQRVKEGILSSGASAKLVHLASLDCTALHGTQSTKYDLPSRDLTANAVEMLCSNDFFDGLVFVASEPNIVVGMLLGAIRLNIPCAFVCEGTMTPIVYNNKEHGFAHFYEQIAKIKTGRTKYEAISEIERNLPLALGTDCERYGANSFNCLLEAVGLAVKGNGTAPASSVERKTIAYKTGELAVQLANDKCTPKRLINNNTLHNLAVLDLACGGSSTTMLNLIAIAKELGIKNFTFKTVGDLAKNTPLLLSRENGNGCIMPQYHNAGGVYAMLKQLLDGKLIKGDAPVNDGTTLADLLKDVAVSNTNVIRPITNSVAPSSRLRVIYGNVAESGAFVQYDVPEGVFTGSAKVYANEEMAIDALLHREIRAGDVLVIRGEGPKSGPGMREIYTSLALLKGFNLEDKVAVITDGRIADFYKGFVVGHITPETGEQNLFSVLQDGDQIEINVLKGKVNCDIKAKELAQRYRDSDVGVGNYGNFFLKNWAKTCSTAVDGCIYKNKK